MILVATFCAQLAMGLACHEAEWPVEPATVLPRNCQAALNALAPRWLERRPGYTLRRFRCVPAARLGRDI